MCSRRTVMAKYSSCRGRVSVPVFSKVHCSSLGDGVQRFGHRMNNDRSCTWTVSHRCESADVSQRCFSLWSSCRRCHTGMAFRPYEPACASGISMQLASGRGNSHSWSICPPRPRSSPCRQGGPSQKEPFLQGTNRVREEFASPCYSELRRSRRLKSVQGSNIQKTTTRRWGTPVRPTTMKKITEQAIHFVRRSSTQKG